MPAIDERSVEAGQLRGVALAVGDVLADVLVEAAGLDGVRPDLRRDAESHRPRRDLGVVGHDGAGADERAGADDRAVEDHRAGPDEAVVLDGAALQMSDVTDHTVVTDPGGVLLGSVHDGAVLNRSARADEYLAIVAAQDGVRPYR